MFSCTEFGIVWSIAFLHWYEELNAQETIEEEGSKDQDNLKKWTDWVVPDQLV